MLCKLYISNLSHCGPHRRKTFFPSNIGIAEYSECKKRKMYWWEIIKKLINIFLCANIADTGNRKLFTIIKSRKQHCSKSMRKFPVKCRKNKEDLDDVTARWRKKTLDEELTTSNRKIILLLCNYTEHPKIKCFNSA